MTPRERVLAAVNRRKPDKIPKDAGHTPAVYEMFREKTGCDDWSGYFKIESRGVGLQPSRLNPDFRVYYDNLPDDAYFDEFGVAHVPGQFYHFFKYWFAMRNMTTVDELREYPWPDFDAEYRWEGVAEETQKLHAQGYFVSGWVGHIFEDSWHLTGMEKLFMDMQDNPAFAAFILDTIADKRAALARMRAETGADMITLGDDVGMQDRLMMSPATYRKWIKPRLARVIAAAREVRPDIPAWYHSDGNVSSIIPDLIEAGVTVLNPVQPECMDLVDIKRRYGDVLAFWGTIGTQTVMPFGTADDVRRTVREMIDLFGRDGGLVLSPTHVLEPEVPWENIVAFFDEVETYGTL